MEYLNEVGIALMLVTAFCFQFLLEKYIYHRKMSLRDLYIFWSYFLLLLGLIFALIELRR